MGAFYLVMPNAGSATDNPVRVRLWHSSGHDSGARLLLVDLDGNVLARYYLPEVSGFNEVLRPLDVEIPYLEPRTEVGFIVVTKWDAKNGEQPVEEAIVCRPGSGSNWFSSVPIW